MALCMRGVNQSVGRAIRHVGDYAAIIFADARYAPSGAATGLVPPAGVAAQLSGCGLTDAARHVTGCHLTRETRVQSALDNAAVRVGPNRRCSPRHGLPFHLNSVSASLVTLISSKSRVY